MSTWQKIGIGVGVVLAVLLLGGGCYFLLTQEGWAANFRDILIIILAVESIAIFAFLGLMLWQLYQLIRLLRDEVVPLINTTKDTVEQVKHTTTFVGQSVAAPVITISGLLAGAKVMVETMRGARDVERLFDKEPPTNG